MTTLPSYLRIFASLQTILINLIVMKNIKPKKIKFESNLKYSYLEQFPNNKNFEIPCWQNENRNSKEILIMINGFLEGVLNVPIEEEIKRQKKINIHLRRYDSIANELLKKNIVSVLMPLPFHFGRGEDFSSRAPIERLMEDGSNLYFGGFDQIIRDVNDLISRIKNNPHEFGLDKKEKNIKFHMLGYSIGGVSAMGCVLKLEHDFKSMNILLSSWNLNAISSDAMHELFQPTFQLGRNEWEKIKSDLDDADIIDPEFNFLWKGEESQDFPLRDKLENKVSKILFINGNHDSLFTQEMATQRAKYLTDKEFDNVTFLFVHSNHLGLGQQGRTMIPKFIATFIDG